MSRGSTSNIFVEGDGTALRKLLEKWEILQWRHPSSTPFQSAAWVGAYFSSFGGDNALAVAVEDASGLRAAASFHRSRHGPARIFTSAPPKVSDFSDVVLGQCEDAAADLVKSLLGVPGWDVLDFPEVPPGADLWRLVPEWPGRVLRSPSSTCIALEGASLDDYAASLPRRKRKKLAQERRKIDRAGVTWSHGGEEPKQAVKRLLGLHQGSWVGRDMNPEHGSQRFEQLLIESVADLEPQGKAFVVQFRHQGHVPGSALFLPGKEYLNIYLTGHSLKLREEVSLHVMELAAGFDLVSDQGLRGVNLLRGLEAYKQAFPGRLETNERVLLLRPGSLAGLAFGGGVRVRQRAASLVRGGRQRWSRRMDGVACD